MSLEEIAKKWGLYMPSSNTRNAMQEYADQQTTEKNSEIERLKAELNELKEKHKRDAIDFADFICLSGYTLMQKIYLKMVLCFLLTKIQ